MHAPATLGTLATAGIATPDTTGVAGSATMGITVPAWSDAILPVTDITSSQNAHPATAPRAHPNTRSRTIGVTKEEPEAHKPKARPKGPQTPQSPLGDAKKHETCVDVQPSKNKPKPSVALPKQKPMPLGDGKHDVTGPVVAKSSRKRKRPNPKTAPVTKEPLPPESETEAGPPSDPPSPRALSPHETVLVVTDALSSSVFTTSECGPDTHVQVCFVKVFTVSHFIDSTN